MTAQAPPDPNGGAGTSPDAPATDPEELELSTVATLPAPEVLAKLGSSDAGLSGGEAGRRLKLYGPNVLLSRGVSAWSVLARQLRSWLLLLLVVAAVVSAVVGDRTEALIIGAIMAMSVGLGFFNEYRSEKAVEELHAAIQHLAAVDRDGSTAELDVTQLVPGDVVHLRVGDVVPADLRLIEVHELECDESVLTGESRAADKTAEAQPPGDSPLDLRSCVFMGTLVSGGGGRGVVVRTGSRTEFGAIAVHLGEQQGVTAFQQGLKEFSRMLAIVTGVLAGSIFVINAVLGRSILQSALFALSIAVGLTPQLLPAIVTVSLSTGARRMAKKRVIVKRLVAIEDLGNVQVLFTDKTGTLTQGQILVHAGARRRGDARRPGPRPWAGLQRQGRQRARPCALGSPEGGPERRRPDDARSPALRPRAPAVLGPGRDPAGEAAHLQGRPRSRPRPVRDRAHPDEGDPRRALRVRHPRRCRRQPCVHR